MTQKLYHHYNKHIIDETIKLRSKGASIIGIANTVNIDYYSVVKILRDYRNNEDNPID